MNDDCDIAMCRMRMLVTQFEQNMTASTPIIADFSQKQGKKDMSDDCDIAMCRLEMLVTQFEQSIRQACL